MSEFVPAIEWIPLPSYREYFDVPRSFIVPAKDLSEYLLFDCPFDDSLDEYQAEYSVYQLPKVSDEQLAGDWATLLTFDARNLGTIPVSALEFDDSRRKAVSSRVYELLSIRT